MAPQRGKQTKPLLGGLGELSLVRVGGISTEGEATGRSPTAPGGKAQGVDTNIGGW